MRVKTKENIGLVIIGLFVLLGFLLAFTCGTAKAGIYNNSGTTAEDSICVTFFFADTLANPVVAASGDSAWLITWYPGGEKAYRDSARIISDSRISVENVDVLTRSMAFYSFQIAVATIDGGGQEGTYKYNFIAHDSSLGLTVVKEGEFQVYATADYSTWADRLDETISTRSAIGDTADWDIDDIAAAIDIDSLLLAVTDANKANFKATGLYDSCAAAIHDSTTSIEELVDSMYAALVYYKLDHLIFAAESDDPADNSIIAKMAASDGDWSGFSAASDALEALRDRGDAAWTTGAGDTADSRAMMVDLLFADSSIARDGTKADYQSSGGDTAQIRAMMVDLIYADSNTARNSTAADYKAAGFSTYDPSTDSVIVDGSAFANLIGAINHLVLATGTITSDELATTAVNKILAGIFTYDMSAAFTDGTFADMIQSDSIMIGDVIDKLQALGLKDSVIAGVLSEFAFTGNYVQSIPEAVGDTMAQDLFNADTASYTHADGTYGRPVIDGGTGGSCNWGDTLRAIYTAYFDTAQSYAPDSAGNIFERLTWLAQNGVASSDTTAIKTMIDSLLRVTLNVARDETKTDYQSTTGDGAIPTIFYAYNSADTTAIEDVDITVRLTDGKTPKHTDKTVGDGYCRMTLSPGERWIYAEHNNYVFDTPACTLSVPESDSLVDTLWATAFDPGTPADPDKIRIYGWLKDAQGNADSGATIILTLDYDPASRDTIPQAGTVTIYKTSETTTTDADGYWYLDVYPCDSIVPYCWYFYRARDSATGRAVAGHEKRIRPTGTTATNIIGL